MKKLTRSNRDRKLCGVCGGIADYFGLDATLIRVVWALCCLFGAGIVAYLVCAVVIPPSSEY